MAAGDLAKQYVPEIKKALKKPVLDEKGRVMIKESLKKAKIPWDKHIKTLATGIMKEAGKSYAVIGNRTNSMPLGPKAVKLGWDIVQSPAVYEIVCKPTGRRYIGQSRRPDLRRAVHLHYLHNVRRFAPSNVFFGVEQIEKDIKKHGVESFYMDLIETFPQDVDDAVLFDAEERHKKAIDQKKLYNFEYNRFDLYPGSKIAGARFIPYEPEMHKLHVKYKKLREEHDHLTQLIAVKKFEFRMAHEEIFELSRQKKIKSAEAKREHAKIVAQSQAIRGRLRDLAKREIPTIEKEIAELAKHLKDKWSQES